MTRGTKNRVYSEKGRRRKSREGVGLKHSSLEVKSEWRHRSGAFRGMKNGIRGDRIQIVSAFQLSFVPFLFFSLSLSLSLSFSSLHFFLTSSLTPLFLAGLSFSDALTEPITSLRKEGKFSGFYHGVQEDFWRASWNLCGCLRKWSLSVDCSRGVGGGDGDLEEQQNERQAVRE